MVIPKHRWNSFFQTDLDLQLRVRGIDTIVICGGSTDVGIASTVFAARDLDYGIVVIRDACYSARGNNNEFFMDTRVPAHGARDDRRPGRRPDVPLRRILHMSIHIEDVVCANGMPARRSLAGGRVVSAARRGPDA